MQKQKQYRKNLTLQLQRLSRSTTLRLLLLRRSALILPQKRWIPIRQLKKQTKRKLKLMQHQIRHTLMPRQPQIMQQIWEQSLNKQKLNKISLIRPMLRQKPPLLKLLLTKLSLIRLLLPQKPAQIMLLLSPLLKRLSLMLRLQKPMLMR